MHFRVRKPHKLTFSTGHIFRNHWKKVCSLFLPSCRDKRAREMSSPSSPNKWEQIKTVANGYFANGDFERAVSEYSKAIQHGPDQSVLFTNRALTHLKLLDFQKAENDALRAVELSSSSMKAYYVLGRCHTHNNDQVKAVRTFKRCLDMVNAADPTMGLYKEIFSFYFRARKSFYDERRASMLLSMREVVDTCKSPSCDNDTRASVMEQLFSALEEGNRIGDEHGSVLVQRAGHNRTSDFFNEVPECFLCPISMEIMKDPVMVIGTANPTLMCSKQSYERECIEKHFLMNGRSDPLGRFEYLPQPVVIPNLTLRMSIHCFLEAHPWLFTD